MTETKVVFVGPGLVTILLILVILIGVNNSGWLMGLIINGIIGLIILMILNYLFKEVAVPINVWTFLIAALGGILGVVLLVLLNVMGVKEW
jgi:inhibitor of the pro-sigma K processing machinery